MAGIGMEPHVPRARQYLVAWVEPSPVQLGVSQVVQHAWRVIGFTLTLGPVSPVLLVMLAPMRLLLVVRNQTLCVHNVLQSPAALNLIASLQVPQFAFNVVMVIGYLVLEHQTTLQFVMSVIHQQSLFNTVRLMCVILLALILTVLRVHQGCT